MCPLVVPDELSRIALGETQLGSSSIDGFVASMR